MLVRPLIASIDLFRPRAARWMLLLGLAATGCERQPELPPELREPVDATPDVNYTATLNGPERLVLASLALKIESGSDISNALSITLSGRGVADEALFLSGNATPRPATTTRSVSQLNKRAFEVIGPGKTWLGPTAGIQSPMARYQAETAIITIDRVVGDVATGRIEGKFWRFDRRDPALRPPTPEQFSGSFAARVTR